MSHRQSSDEYEVFLNFRGTDLRQGLINGVWNSMKDAGIRYFYDDESVRPGDNLQKILRSVEISHIYVVMLSVNYAQSKWCLRELARIVKCEEESNGGKVILPFFCDVRVENVKLKENSLGSYKDALGNLTAEAEERREWEAALRKVAGIKGLHRGNIGDVDFSQMIVKLVLECRLKKHLILSCHTLGTGIDEEARKLKEMLDIESGDVRFLVIHGKEGAGKTTLARAVFQQLSGRFQGSSFISDLRGIPRHRHFEDLLQRKMLRDICGDHKKSGDITKDFREKKVLIVLDDVEENHQIENLHHKTENLTDMSAWFGPGSSIIITTSNRELLSNKQGSSEDPIEYPLSEVLGHKVRKMKLRPALRLFSRLAFWEDEPLETFKTLSIDIVNLCLGLPLIIEIMGSLLHRERDIEVWKEIKNRLLRAHSVQEKLMISFDKLNDSMKEIFLDVACFFVNEDRTNPTYMWDKAKELDDLCMLSLVKIVEGDKLWMHGYLRDLGRKIVQCQLDPFKRCRFWEHREALQVLQTKQGVKEVRAICIPYRMKQLMLSSDEFSKNCQLWFLKLFSVSFKGDFEDRFSQLRWLSCHDSPQDFAASNFASAHLVILDLAKSRITHEWPAWNQIGNDQVVNNLKVIDLTCCENITKTPAFSRFTFLERLILEGCTRLTEIHSSISQLTNLKCLNLKGCDSLEVLPNEICSLRTLTEIRISKKEAGPFSLPAEIGSIKSLTILEIVNVKLNELPESIKRLENLQRLSLLKCSGFEQLPASVGRLQSLVELQISETTITGFPESIGGLKELKVIKMEKSLISRLPRSIIELENLEELHAGHSQHLKCDIAEIFREQPVSQGQATPEDQQSGPVASSSKLKILDLSNTSVGKLPETFEDQQKLQFPTNLVSLGITIPAGSKVPNLFYGLTHLEKLELHVPHETKWSPEFRFPGNLKSLLLSYHNSRCSLEFPPNLTEFPTNSVGPGITVPAGSQVPNLFEGLTHLEKLELHVPHETNSSPEFRFPGNLKSLLLSYNNSRCSLEFPPNLSELILENMKVETRFLNVQSLKSLKLNNCNLIKANEGKHSIGVINSAARFVSLCHFVNELHPPKDLRVLHITQCNFGHVLSRAVLHLSGLKCLRQLNISCWKGLVEVRGLEKLELLEELYIHSCVSLVRLRGDISYSKRLKVFSCPGNVKLKELDGYERLSSREDVKTNFLRCSLPLIDIPESNGRPRQRVGSTSPENRKEEAGGDFFLLYAVHFLVVLLALFMEMVREKIMAGPGNF